MNIGLMRTTLRRCLAGRTDVLDNAELDRAMNYVWREQIPNRVTGGFRNGTALLTFVTGKDTYFFEEIDLDLRSLKPGAKHADEDKDIRYFDREDQFWARNNFSDQPDNKPMSYLPYEDRVIVRPAPNSEWDGKQLLIPATFYREPVPDPDGLRLDEDSYAVVYGAAVHLAAQYHWEALIEVNNSLFQNALRAIRARSVGKRRNAATRERKDF